jgi:uncharacterized membrane protein YpjA
MTKEKKENAKPIRSMYALAMANVGIWAIAMIAMVFLMQDSPSVKRLFPILGGGTAVGVALISAISKTR